VETEREDWEEEEIVTLELGLTGQAEDGAEGEEEGEDEEISED